MKKILAFVLIIAVILILPVSASPGDNNDPIIVLSYLNQRFTELINQYNLSKVNEYDKRIQELETKLATTSSSASSLVVVTLNAGEKLIADAGTEIILRSGAVTAIASELGGLSDVTGAKDISQDEELISNHLIIVPRNDGRGVFSANGAILMVRGNYQVIK